MNTNTMAIAALIAAAAVVGGAAVYVFTGSFSSGSDIEYTEVDSIEGFEITYVSGTEAAYKLYSNSAGENTVVFSGFAADSVYRLAGTLAGNISVVTEGYGITFELNGVTVSSNVLTPILVTGGSGSLAFSVTENTQNTVYGYRATGDGLYAVKSTVDTAITGTGSLKIGSTYNAGIYSDGALTVDSTDLQFDCCGDAVTADSFAMPSGSMMLMSSAGNGITTINGSVTLGSTTASTTVDIHATGEGIKSAAAVEIAGDDTVVSVQTSDMSKRTTVNTIYIGYANTNFAYSILVTYEDGATEWVNPSGEPSAVKHAMVTEYVYTFEVEQDAKSFVIYAYTSAQQQGQSDSYWAKSVSIETGFENNSLLITQCVYGTDIMYRPAQWGGPGGEMTDEETIGISAATTVTIAGGDVTVRAQGTAVTAADITVSGGRTTAFSRTDTFSATGTVSFTGGDTVLICGSTDGSAIRSGSAYTLTGGRVMALCPNTESAQQAMDNTSASKVSQTFDSLSSGTYLTVTDGETLTCVITVTGNDGRPPEMNGEPPEGAVTAEMAVPEMQTGDQQGGKPPEGGPSSGYLAVYIGSATAAIASATSVEVTLDANGVFWV